jgi:hypothetical protein
MRKRLVMAILGGSVLGGVLWVGGAQRERGLSPSQEIMWRKLDLSHETLDALALDDFEAIVAYSDDLEAMSRAEAWTTLSSLSDSQPYLSESAQFRRAARELGDAARAKDSERAALAYVDLTLRCVRCHRLLGSLPQR